MKFKPWKNTEEKITLSVVEDIQIKDVGEAVAKVDTGNEAYNVLHGTDIEHSGTGVRFKTLHNKVIERPVLEEIEINIGSGNLEKRPVVAIEFTMRGRTYTKPFSIADRSTNDEPVLLGEVFLREIDAIVDVNM
jgi:hypothetical protein